MAAIVVLSVALMVACVGVAVVAALQLKRVAGRLTDEVKTTLQRVQPLIGELGEGAAVAATESETLRGSLERMKTVRRGEKRRGR